MIQDYEADKRTVTYTQVIDKNFIIKMQKKFCETANVFAVYTDESGCWVTDMQGNEEDIPLIKQLVSTEQMNGVYRRIAGSILEEQVVEDTAYPELKIAAVSVKNDGKSVMNWIICGVLEDCMEQDSPCAGIHDKTTTKKFYAALDLLQAVSARAISYKLKYTSADAERKRSRTTQEEMSVSLKRTETLMNIIQLLESEESIELIMEKVIQFTGQYLELSSGEVFRMNKDGKTMDVMAEWCRPGLVSVFDKVRNLPISPLLQEKKTRVISSGSKVGKEERAAMEAAKIKAMLVIPIYINNSISMYAVFNECKKEREWQLEEVKFANSAVKVIQSITVRRIQKNSLISSYASLEAILDNVGSAIYVKDSKTQSILFANKLLKTNFAGELADGTLDILFEKGKPVGNMGGTFEINHAVKNRWYDLHYTYIKWVDGRKVALCAIYDITDKKIYQRKIEQQAYTDFLTGLYNRMCCEKDLALQIDNAKRNNTQGALLYLDLDDFKHINDGLGHQYGDVLLKAISHSFQQIEGIEQSCYRMGGDEFVIVISPESYPRYHLILEEIKDIFSKPWFLKDADYYCTMSMGTVHFPKDGEDVQNLIKKADIAMYEAKKSGKNRIATYSDKFNSASNKRLDMEKNMRDDTSGNYKSFEVYYQPIIDIQREGFPCVGAEALVRWNSKEMGAVSPAEFIPLAEYLGLINPIGNHVLREACEACKYWNDNGHPNYKVNVNLSVVQLLQSDIVDKIKEAIVESGIIPHNLTLEVTESLAINDMARMKEILKNIKKLGVRIALDDFGTGYSSLNHIREIPLDVIKVDQSFVIDLAEDTYSQSFIKMISELAGSIGVSICVEGIETKEQYKVLEGMQVRLIQGYYFDRPMPKEQFEQKYVE